MVEPKFPMLLMYIYQEGYVLGYVEISNCHNLGYMRVLA